MITVTQALLNTVQNRSLRINVGALYFAGLLLYPTTIVGDEIFSGFKEERRIQP